MFRSKVKSVLRNIFGGTGQVERTPPRPKRPKPYKLGGGRNQYIPYIVEYMLWGFPDRVCVRVGVEAVEGDEVWMSISQFLSLMDWGAQERETLEQLSKEQGNLV